MRNYRLKTEDYRNAKLKQKKRRSQMANILHIRGVLCAVTEFNILKRRIVSLLKNKHDFRQVIAAVAISTNCDCDSNKQIIKDNHSKCVVLIKGRKRLGRPVIAFTKCISGAGIENRKLNDFGLLSLCSNRIIRSSDGGRISHTVSGTILFGHCCFKNPYSFARSIVTSRNLQKSHYDALGITPSATQADIKDAYYKLSMKYHPDRNEGSTEAVNKFRDITAAYEILGNYRLRKLYDKGVLQRTALGAEDEEEELDAQTRFYRSRVHRDRPPPPTGKTPIYNFDEWTRAHYGDTFARRVDAKARWQQRVYEERMNRYHSENLTLFVILGVCGVLLVLLSVTYEKYDNVLPKHEPNTEQDKSNQLSKNL